MFELLEQRRLLSGTVVTITTPDHAVTEGEIITFEVQRTGDLSEALTLDVTLSGTATPGVDTMIPDGSLIFAPGEDTATYSLAAVPDVNAEVTENLVARVDTLVETDILIDRGNIDVSIDNVPAASPLGGHDAGLGEPEEQENLPFAIPVFPSWNMFDNDDLDRFAGRSLVAGVEQDLLLPVQQNDGIYWVSIPAGSNIRVNFVQDAGGAVTPFIVGARPPGMGVITIFGPDDPIQPPRDE
ncbi:MAG: hypothetical protein AAGD32_02685 [Planctomycetota bacterium]